MPENPLQQGKAKCYRSRCQLLTCSFNFLQMYLDEVFKPDSHIWRNYTKQCLHMQAEMFIGICFYNIIIFSVVKLANLLVQILMKGLDLLQRNPVNSVLPETTWSGRGFQGGTQKSCFQSEPPVFIGRTFSHTEYSSKS